MMDNKDDQRRQGRESWLRELLKGNKIQAAEAYAAKWSLELPTDAPSGGAGVADPAPEGKADRFTPPQIFSDMAGLPAVDVVMDEAARIAASVPPLPVLPDPEVQVLGSVMPRFYERVEPPPVVEPVLGPLPEGVERVKVMRALRNRNQWLVSRKGGMRAVLWATYREGRLLRTGKLVCVQANREALQGGFVLWSR
jgi:hypothetical protein